MARKIIVALGLLFFVAGGVFWWRVTHPLLTDLEQVEANLEDIRSSLENGATERALGYLDEDGKFSGQSVSQLRSQLTLGYRFGRPDVRVTFTNTRTEIKGATATTQGHYKVDVRRGRSQAESSDGDFSITWQKRDGQWKITDGNASGGIPSG